MKMVCNHYFSIVRILTSSQPHTHILTYSHNHILTYSHIHIFTYSHPHILTFSHTRILTYSYTHMLTYSHTYILTYSHTYIDVCDLYTDSENDDISDATPSVKKTKQSQSGK